MLVKRLPAARRENSTMNQRGSDGGEGCEQTRRNLALEGSINSICRRFSPRCSKETYSINSRYIHSQSEYKLAFKDGSDAKHIPGIGPKRLFTLRRYKGESRLGYGPITLFLRPEGGIFKELRRYVDEDDDLLCDGAKSATKDSSDDEDFTKSD